MTGDLTRKETDMDIHTHTHTRMHTPYYVMTETEITVRQQQDKECQECWPPQKLEKAWDNSTPETSGGPWLKT